MDNLPHSQNVLDAIVNMYLSIQDIDLRTGNARLVCENGSEEGGVPDTPQSSADDMLREVCSTIDGEFKPVMGLFTDLSTLPERLASANTLAVEYLDDRQYWHRARFIVAERDLDGNAVRVLWLLESIEEEKRHRDKLKALSETDPLTGVRSRHAFLMKEKELDETIEAGAIDEFAIVACDVNDVEKVNDTHGHKVGDEHIREACRMICEIFQHSPVFRIGGDEFAVVLADRDYVIRKDLMITLHDRSADHITAGGAVVSGGLADFRAGQDKSVYDVLKNAEERMCVEKRILASMGTITRDEVEDESSQDALIADLIARQSIIKVKRHLLIVDDEEINREILGVGLQGGYELLYAADGFEALEQAHAHKDELAAILLDLLMPRLSGMEVLRTLKADEELKDIPVIVMTADQDAELECLNLGAMDFIPKPYPKWEIVRARVSKCIELSEDRDIIRITERDNLTGLFNIDYFMRYVNMFDQHYRDLPMDAVVVDVNRFHMVNERFGRSYGDLVLQRLGERMRAAVRELSGVGSRQDADTFLIYCPHQEDYTGLLERLSANLAGDEEPTARIRLRIGVYENADKNLDFERRFDHARQAANAMRGGSSAPIGKYDSELHEAELYREHLLEEFKPSLENGCFEVHFQPKFDIRPDVPVLASAEALIRWNHPELGMISPGVFIPLFEDNGLILELDKFVWQETAARIREWKDRLGYSVPVSVNVSRIDMLDLDLKDILDEILSSHDLSESDLLLEITESAYAEDFDQIISTVNELRGTSMGFRIEMDDFGTGYSSLGMLSQLPIDVLKLDISFVRNAFGETRDMRMIEMILDIADYLHVPVVAEGVETEEQYLVLKAMGCDYVQGYYFGKPVPPAEFERFLVERGEEGVEIAPVSNKSKPNISKTLASKFESVYYVDTATSHYLEFFSGKDGDLEIRPGGLDFFADIREKLLADACEEDAGELDETLSKDALARWMEQVDAEGLSFRLMRSGESVPYHLLTVETRSSDAHHVVVGMRPE